MAGDAEREEDKRGFVPNPYESIAPVSVEDAMEDAVRYLGGHYQRAEVIELVAAAEPHRVLLVAQGFPTDRPLTLVEDRFSQTVQYCKNVGLMSHPIEAIGAMTYVQSLVAEGGVFMGTERPNKPHVPQRTTK